MTTPIETTVINLRVRRGVVFPGNRDAEWYGPGICSFPTAYLEGLREDVLLPVPEQAVVSIAELEKLATVVEGSLRERFGDHLAELLEKAGYRTVDQVMGTTGRKLSMIPGIGVTNAKKIKLRNRST